MWNCLWGHALKRSPGVIRKNRVSYPGPGFLSSATWPSLPKKHYNGLNQTINITKSVTLLFIVQSMLLHCNPPNIWIRIIKIAIQIKCLHGTKFPDPDLDLDIIEISLLLVNGVLLVN